MQKIQQLKFSRIYGIIGVALEFTGVPAFLLSKVSGFIISITGLILLFLAFKFISNDYSNQTPFRYMLYSLISGIILVVASGVLLFLVHIPGVNSATGANNTSTISTSFTTILLLVLFTFMVPAILSISFQYLAYSSVGKLSGVNEFHTAGLLLVIGTIITIISIVIFVSFIGVSRSTQFIDAITISILIGDALIFPGIARLIIAFIKLPGEEKHAENEQNFNRDTHREIP